MISFEEYFSTGNLMWRLILGFFAAIFLLVLWFWMARPCFKETPLDVWRKQVDTLPTLSSDVAIQAAIAGEPRCYLVQNYKFDKGSTVSDTQLHACRLR